MVRRHKPRRGVVLLVVLTLLTLLIVIGITFIALTGQARRAAEANAVRERYRDDPADLADRTVYQLLRDTNLTSRSVLRGHSLLRDMYDLSVAGTVVSRSLSGEFLTVVFIPGTGFNASRDHYNGCVFSSVDPVSKTTLSARVVRYMPDSSNPANSQLIVEWPYGNASLPAANSNFLVNGRAFAGTGAGYSPATLSLDEAVDNTVPREMALLPNFGQYDGVINPNTGAPYDPDAGGLNEPYDAVDFQNMALAMNPPNASVGIIPSFHRPALVNYWLKRFGSEELTSMTTAQRVAAFRDPSNVPDAATRQRLINLKRAIILRPLPEDHPNFPNSAQFRTTMGLPDQGEGIELAQMIWDVDNDGDGIPDSVWLDVGLPVQTDSSGRRYRPLVAILCQDLDGRLNLNAHGSVEQWNEIYQAAGQLTPVPLATPPGYPFAADTSGGIPAMRQELLPRGLGYGPADIFFGHLLSRNDFYYMFQSRYSYSGGALTRAAGIYDRDDPLSAIKQLGIPYDYYNNLNGFALPPIPTAYASPPDLWGTGGVGLDPTGHPLYYGMGRETETKDDPYELVLNQDSAGFNDNPFTVAELERLLRYHDLDAAVLPKRLVYNTGTDNVTPAPPPFVGAPIGAFTGNSAAAEQNRRMVTTVSSHVSVPSSDIPVKLRAAMQAGDSKSLLGIYRILLRNGGVAPANIEDELEKIVPWEIMHGEKFNINRLLGNGRDDNGNGIVDEPVEADAGEAIWPNGLHPTYNPGTCPPLNYLNDDPVIGINRFAPQIYARHLYCLMMLLVDHYNGNEFYHPLLEDLSQVNSGVADSFERRELTAQRIAQWAINVVDFRDSNAIMTPFEYDVNPFNGWQPMDGNPVSNEPGERRIVWGMEQPELLITETVAFHDRRVRDTTFDTTGERIDPMGADQTMDQYRIPQGSLFMEFYATRSRIRMDDPGPPATTVKGNFVQPAELYVNGRLNLAAAPNGLPVWRVAISESHHSGASSGVESPWRRRSTKPETTSFQPYEDAQPDSMSLLPFAATATPDRLNIERIVWFSPLNPTTLPPAVLPPTEVPKIFYNRSGVGNVQVAPASYFVVGPRATTTMGSQNPPPPAITPPAYLPSQQNITLTNTQVQYTDNTGNPHTPSFDLVRPATTMVAAANPPQSWADPSNPPPPIGLNITEPLPDANYYRRPTLSLSDANGFPVDSWYDYGNPAAGVLPDEPFDSRPGAPLYEDGILETETTQDYKTAFLQRLANPTEPWHPMGNPYITVDWQPIDVTVFNGEDFPGAPDPDDGNSSPNPDFETRERGNSDLNLWSVNNEAPNATSAVPTSPDYFNFNLVHSLGYLNETFAPAAVTNHPDGSTLVRQSAASATRLPAPMENYIGDPALGPFPWLAWHNRPFANPMELMQVPASTPGRLTHEFDIYRTGTPRDDPYEADLFNPGTPSGVAAWAHFRGTFPHLLNFFHSSQTDASNQLRRGANFYRLFDYVETPSPYVGAEKWYNPTTLGGSNFHYHPPYNHLSRFRDPGRVNFNTWFDSRIWEGVSKSYPLFDPSRGGGPTQMYGRIMASRRGYPFTSSAVELNSDYPTLFANPLRTADSADLMPDVGTPVSMRKTEPVQATLLREDLFSSPSRTDALFVPDASVVPEAQALYQNQDRNSHFRYHGLARLSNLVSSTSNVYGVWITIGYFEVEANTNPATGLVEVDRAHPDGLRLGAELGTDTGKIQRNRAFYVIDRSVPVAFEPGQNHNVDKAILLRRFIE